MNVGWASRAFTPVFNGLWRALARRAHAFNQRRGRCDAWARRARLLPYPSSTSGAFAHPTENAAALRPGAGGLCLLLELLDLVALHHGEADVIETLEQAMLAVCVDVEFQHAAVGTADFLLLQVDRQRRIGAALGVVEQLLQVALRDHDRQDAVLEAVVVEDVAERGRDHAADAEIEQRPGRVLARGTAAEVVVGDEDLGLAIGRLVQHEIRVLAAVVTIAPLREQARAQPGALDRLQILLGDDHVRVDIDHLQRGRDAFERGEFFHCLRFSDFPRLTPDYRGRCGGSSAHWNCSVFMTEAVFLSRAAGGNRRETRR